MFNSSSDPFIKALKSFGYNTVRLPKVDIMPLQVFSRNGNNLERLGALTKLLTPGETIAAPPITSGVPTSNINGKRTGDIKIGLGLSILGNIIGAMGGSSLGIETEYKQAKSAVFEFSGVTEDRLEVIDLDQYLGDADINPASVFVGKLLEADQLYVTTAVLKSTKFTFEATQSSGIGVKVNVPVIQGVVGGNVSVGTTSGSESKLSYEGKIPLAFAFQAVQIFYDQGKYTAFKPVEDVALKSLSNITGTTANMDLLMTTDTFVRVID
jgi:hypothetical protein